jgi:hypothetical protein
MQSVTFDVVKTLPLSIMCDRNDADNFNGLLLSIQNLTISKNFFS